MNLIFMLFSAGAFAQDCDSAALVQSLADASPVTVARKFNALAQCDDEAAGEELTQAFERMLYDRDAIGVLQYAIGHDQPQTVLDWVADLRSDERAGAIAGLGVACAGDENIANFLTSTRDLLGDQFWSHRWYRALTECRYDSVRELLTEEIEASEANHDNYLGLLDVWARNLGPEALPRLREMVLSESDPEIQSYIVNAFGSTARPGSVYEGSEDAALAAATAITEIAPALSLDGLRQTIPVLEALGAMEASTSLPGAHFESSMWSDGLLHYGVIVVDSARCSRGRIIIGAHVSEFTEAGRRFPEEVAEQARGAMDAALAPFQEYENCRGGEGLPLEVIVSEVPMLSPEVMAVWVAAKVAELEGKSPWRFVRYDEPSVVLP
jgi:hypothetical protein